MSSRIVTLPHVLTIFRMALTPVFVSLLFYQKFVWALAAFVVAGITDGLDGLLARRFQQQSELGRILDPIADKMMLLTSVVVLSIPGVFPTPLPKRLPVPFCVTITAICPPSEAAELAKWLVLALISFHGVTAKQPPTPTLQTTVSRQLKRDERHNQRCYRGPIQPDSRMIRGTK